MKTYEYAITFQEFPDEVTLCLNISNCPGLCKYCSEPWLREDIGTTLTLNYLDELIEEHPDITMIAFMGGDANHSEIFEFGKYIKNTTNLKVGFYSGRDYLNMNLLQTLDYYKIGRWICPEGPVEDWYKKTWGPIVFPFSNQLLFKKEGDKWINITERLREKPLGNLENYIIRD